MKSEESLVSHPFTIQSGQTPLYIKVSFPISELVMTADEMVSV